MSLDITTLKRSLAQHAPLIASLATGINVEQAQWKPAPDAWSILEVINHLYDEECEDFRAHLDIALHHPDRPWPETYPGDWVVERHYNERELAPSVQGFIGERRASLNWLDSLAAPNWDAVITAPFGQLRAGDIFVSWVVHDQWHMQQLIQLRRAYTTQQVAPYKVWYAGEL